MFEIKDCGDYEEAKKLIKEAAPQDRMGSKIWQRAC